MEIKDMDFSQLCFKLTTDRKEFMNKSLNICEACISGDLDVVKDAISNGTVKVDHRNNALIELASRHCKLDIVKYLIEQGADVTANHNEAIKIACTWGNVDIIEVLLAHGADIADDNYYAVDLACKNGRLEVIEFLERYCSSKNIEFGWCK